MIHIVSNQPAFQARKYVAPAVRFSDLATERNFLTSQIDDYGDNPIFGVYPDFDD